MTRKDEPRDPPPSPAPRKDACESGDLSESATSRDDPAMMPGVTSRPPDARALPSRGEPPPAESGENPSEPGEGQVTTKLPERRAETRESGGKSSGAPSPEVCSAILPGQGVPNQIGVSAPNKSGASAPNKSGAQKNPPIVEDKRKRSKRAARIVVIVVAALLVVGLVLYFLPYERILAALFPRDEPAEPTGEGIVFYPADESVDILADPDYTSRARYLRIAVGGETIFIFSGEDAREAGLAPELLWRYLQALIAGDADAYNALFTEDYLEGHGKKSDFPMQRVYDASASLYSEHTFTEEELGGDYKGVTQVRYELTYRIARNDGTVRRDVAPDEARPIYVEIFIDEKDNSAKINSIGYGKE